MSNKDTKPNIKRVIADTFGTVSGWFVSSAIAVTACFTFIPDVLDIDITLPDQTGSAMEKSIIAQHQKNFAQLQAMKSQINLLEAETAFTGGSTELTDLKTAFGKQAVAAYTDIYLAGATSEGAALSEQNFNKLHNIFANSIADPADFGFYRYINAAMLDETLANTNLSVQNSLDRFETVKQLNSELLAAVYEQQNEKDKSFSILKTASITSCILGSKPNKDIVILV